MSERSIGERSDGPPGKLLRQSTSVQNLFRRTSSFGATAQIALMRYHQEKFPGRKWWILHPEGPWCSRWDLLTSFALIYTALSTPYEVAFISRPPMWLFCLNRVAGEDPGGAVRRVEIRRECCWPPIRTGTVTIKPRLHCKGNLVPFIPASSPFLEC